MTESVGFEGIKRVYFGGFPQEGNLGLSRDSEESARHWDTLDMQQLILSGRTSFCQGDGYEKNRSMKFGCLVFVTASRMPNGGGEQQEA